MSPKQRPRVLHIELSIESDDELAVLEGGLLAARASELSQMRRRGDRLAFGYGTDSARETMTAEVAQAERRWTMLGRLLESLKAASQSDAG